MFAFALIGTYCRIGLFRLGLSGVDVSILIQLFDGMRQELRTQVPVYSPVLA